MPIDTSFNVAGRSLVRDVFVETGFYKGDTVAAALEAGFPEVHSVEFDADLFRLGQGRFYDEPRVSLHLGSSPEILPRILNGSRATTIYLDAHFCGVKETTWDKKYGECPLVDELKAISRVKWVQKPYLVIDDWHMFRRPWSKYLLDRFTVYEWPSSSDVVSLLRGYHLEETEFVLYAFPEN